MSQRDIIRAQLEAIISAANTDDDVKVVNKYYGKRKIVGVLGHEAVDNSDHYASPRRVKFYNGIYTSSDGVGGADITATQLRATAMGHGLPIYFTDTNESLFCRETYRLTYGLDLVKVLHKGEGEYNPAFYN